MSDLSTDLHLLVMIGECTGTDLPFDVPMMKTRKFGSQLDIKPYWPGMVAIFAYASDCGIKSTPTVMPARVSFSSHRGLYLGSQCTTGTLSMRY